MPARRGVTWQINAKEKKYRAQKWREKGLLVQEFFLVQRLQSPASDTKGMQVWQMEEEEDEDGSYEEVFLVMRRRDWRSTRSLLDELLRVLKEEQVSCTE